MPYIYKNINAGEVNESDIIKTRNLSSVPIDHLLEVISKVNKIHNGNVRQDD